MSQDLKISKLKFQLLPLILIFLFKITTEEDSMATMASDGAEQGVDSDAMEKQDEEMDSKT